MDIHLLGSTFLFLAETSLTNNFSFPLLDPPRERASQAYQHANYPFVQ